MCGIFGVISPAPIPKRDWTEKACRSLAHRGPDAQGLYERGPVMFGHRRLSILDLALGAQPMETPDGRLCITFNGEIYNHLELRAELAPKGHVFRTTSDTETLLACFQEWGTDCLDRLRGMYSFAIADFERSEVFIARDRFGIKPLSYRCGPDFFAFASEIPALVDLPPYPKPGIDPESLALFFRYQYIPSPHSIYAEIKKLQPGHAMLVGFDGCVKNTWRHWSFQFKVQQDLRQEDALQMIDSALADTVAAHTLSDVPFGIFLSGGIDSTLIAMYIARYYGTQIPAFTIAFSEQEYSELQHAQLAAKHFGFNLHVSYLKSPDLNKLDSILSHFGEPFGDSSILPTWHVCEFARQHVPVVLSGDGGDELFGGYRSYGDWIRNQMNSGQLGAQRRENGDTNIAAVLQNWHKQIEQYPREWICALLREPYSKHTSSIANGFRDSIISKHSSALNFAQLSDINTYLPECILPKVDISSMHHGLEVRPPFLDEKVQSIASILPERHRYTSTRQGKVLLKKILEKNGLPESFVYRKKQGFAIPRIPWFLPDGPAYNALLSSLNEQRNELMQYINVDIAIKILNAHSRENDMSCRLWLLLAFSSWLRTRQY